jgi:hypothetical protein
VAFEKLADELVQRLAGHGRRLLWIAHVPKSRDEADFAPHSWPRSRLGSRTKPTLPHEDRRAHNAKVCGFETRHRYSERSPENEPSTTRGLFGSRGPVSMFDPVRRGFPAGRGRRYVRASRWARQRRGVDSRFWFGAACTDNQEGVRGDVLRPKAHTAVTDQGPWCGAKRTRCADRPAPDLRRRAQPDHHAGTASRNCPFWRKSSPADHDPRRRPRRTGSAVAHGSATSSAVSDARASLASVVNNAASSFATSSR